MSEEIIRTLGFYQPFGSLMFHGKLETRWVRKGKKPPSAPPISQEDEKLK